MERVDEVRIIILTEVITVAATAIQSWHLPNIASCPSHFIIHKYRQLFIFWPIKKLTELADRAYSVREVARRRCLFFSFVRHPLSLLPSPYKVFASELPLENSTNK
jgi:hypothetical protein